MSYAIDSKSSDIQQYTREFNSFVIFDPSNLLVCRDFEFIDLIPVKCRSLMSAQGVLLIEWIGILCRLVCFFSRCKPSCDLLPLVTYYLLC